MRSIALLTRHCLILLLLASLAVPASAALPAKLDGHPLPSLAPMLERVLPAVVNVSVTSLSQASAESFEDTFLRQFFDLPEQHVPPGTEKSAGSGVIVDADAGYIVTNHHVIRNAQAVKITLYNSLELEARVIGSDAAMDIALLQVDSKNLQQFPLGNSDRLRIGDFVVAVGNAFGLGHTATSGIISALGRTGLGIERYEDFIQTDASINPGNSGGALVNLRGELIGINAAILAPGGGNIGIGFSIPINRVQQLIAQLTEYGDIQRGVIGVISEDLPPAYTSAQKAPTRSGALIIEVINGSPAEAADIQAGDIVVRVGDEQIDSSSDLRNTLGLVRAGSSRDIEFWRGTQLKKIEVQIKDPYFQRKLAKTLFSQLSGANFIDVTISTHQGPRGAILVTGVEAGSPSEKIGLQRDDIIIGANQLSIESLDGLREIIEKSTATLRLILQRDSERIELKLK